MTSNDIYTNTLILEKILTYVLSHPSKDLCVVRCISKAFFLEANRLTQRLLIDRRADLALLVDTPYPSPHPYNDFKERPFFCKSLEPTGSENVSFNLEFWYQPEYMLGLYERTFVARSPAVVAVLRWLCNRVQQCARDDQEIIGDYKALDTYFTVIERFFPDPVGFFTEAFPTRFEELSFLSWDGMKLEKRLELTEIGIQGTDGIFLNWQRLQKRDRLLRFQWKDVPMMQVYSWLLCSVTLRQASPQ